MPIYVGSCSTICKKTVLHRFQCLSLNPRASFFVYDYGWQIRPESESHSIRCTNENKDPMGDLTSIVQSYIKPFMWTIQHTGTYSSSIQCAISTPPSASLIRRMPVRKLQTCHQLSCQLLWEQDSNHLLICQLYISPWGFIFPWECLTFRRRELFRVWKRLSCISCGAPFHQAAHGAEQSFSTKRGCRHPSSVRSSLSSDQQVRYQR